jgi:hypothetical protein
MGFTCRQRILRLRALHRTPQTVRRIACIFFAGIHTTARQFAWHNFEKRATNTAQFLNGAFRE